MHHKSVIIEPQPRTDVPAPQAQLVLRINRRLDVPFPLIRKTKGQLRPGIELSRIGYRVLQGLVHRTENDVHTRLPIVMSAVPCEVGSRVPFAVAAVLRNENGSGGRV